MSAALGEAAIVGIGESRLGRVAGLSALELQREAAEAALADAGLSWNEVDGLLTTPLRTEAWAMPCGMVAQEFGLDPRYVATLDVAGASGTSMVMHAAMAVVTGQARAVLCVAGQPSLSHRGRDAAVKVLSGAGWAHPALEAPYGPLVPTLYALVAQSHMAEYGTTAEQLAEVAVAIRAWAGMNPNAQKREPISVHDVLASPMVTSPLRVLDCALVSDGAAAFIVAARDRARDLRHRLVRLLGAGSGFSHAYVGDHDALTTTGAVRSGREAFGQAGVRPADVHVAELYDCFTITVIVELEDLGFCAKGEGGAFVQGGRIGPGGVLPVTTHGGLLSAGHPGLSGGMFHVIEAVRQLRGEAGPRQVPDAELALVHGNGGVIGLHCSLILGRA